MLHVSQSSWLQNLSDFVNPNPKQSVIRQWTTLFAPDSTWELSCQIWTLCVFECGVSFDSLNVKVCFHFIFSKYCFVNSFEKPPHVSVNILPVTSCPFQIAHDSTIFISYVVQPVTVGHENSRRFLRKTTWMSVCVSVCVCVCECACLCKYEQLHGTLHSNYH